MERIPIVILNFNRAGPLREMVRWCVSLDGAGEIHIFDNGSTWRPTLDLYKELKSQGIKVHGIGSNLGRAGAADFIGKTINISERMAFSDPDLVPLPDTPGDVLAVCSEILDANPTIVKVGPSLEIRDLPEGSFWRAWIEVAEAPFWSAEKTSCGRGRFAAIDTTFAVYRSGERFMHCDVNSAIRLERPRTLRHVDWYEDPDMPSAEYANYMRLAERDASGVIMMKAFLKNRGEFLGDIKSIKSDDRLRGFWEKYFYWLFDRKKRQA